MEGEDGLLGAHELLDSMEDLALELAEGEELVGRDWGLLLVAVVAVGILVILLVVAVIVVLIVLIVVVLAVVLLLLFIFAIWVRGASFDLALPERVHESFVGMLSMAV